MARKTESVIAEREPDRVKCCHDSCLQSAIVKIPTKTGWANVCMRHYEQHHQNEAEAYCESLGLVTKKQQREYCLAKIGKLLGRAA